ncbi:hypothetical protein PVK06_005865 [Gossypium arboreum]|uniref:RNase H type-1 domain-containing protein n=1 Tax=Gossypium arboreum TaxID=29729 RepID=A0ABR0QWP9_GOSAR|nr:hypothetical protein PVK06_005865 [Gossypium arboreum]
MALCLAVGEGGFIDEKMSTQEAECSAFERSIELAGHLNVNGDVLFETDHASLVNIMDRCNTDITITGDIIRACKAAFNNFKSANLVWANPF